ncbi:MAG: GAK system CofD-like protein [Desulfovibrionaceae bacterium]|nr:GAK system CofD-like protein [Desulfovibrionaceae bacterium]
MRENDSEHGLRFLFFTGGTALRAISTHLKASNPASQHIVTTFDSGGSTAELRRCFAIPALGDVRNRLLALADDSLLDPAVTACFAKRLPMTGSRASLVRMIGDLSDPADQYWSATPPPAIHFLTQTLARFLALLPDDFDPRGASVGNCIVAAHFLKNKRQFAPTLAFFHDFLHVRGRVIPIVDDSFHLGCVLRDGTTVLGQHTFKAIRQAIRSVFLTVHEPDRQCVPDVCRPKCSDEALRAIGCADAIVYPIGSFYSSVLVNLLVAGVGGAIAARACPKIFIPNVGFDPELIDCSIENQCRALLAAMRDDVGEKPVDRFLNYVLVDSAQGEYMGRFDASTRAYLAHAGIRLIDRPICPYRDRHDPLATIRALNECVADWRRAHGE